MCTYVYICIDRCVYVYRRLNLVSKSWSKYYDKGVEYEVNVWICMYMYIYIYIYIYA